MAELKDGLKKAAQNKWPGEVIFCDLNFFFPKNTFSEHILGFSPYNLKGKNGRATNVELVVGRKCQRRLVWRYPQTWLP